MLDSGAVRLLACPQCDLLQKHRLLTSPRRPRCPSCDALVVPARPLRLHIDIEELDALIGREATVRGRWRLSGTDTTVLETGACTSRRVLQSADIDELVLAWSRGLSDISSALALSVQHWAAPGASHN
jgi:ABC-type transport auxiliary lipoprotein component